MAGHYDVLGVPPSASAEEVRRAYLALARRHHPDTVATGGADALAEAGRRMRAINAAWAVLGDPASRAAYDAGLGLRADEPDPETGDPDLFASFLVPDPPAPPSTGADLVTLVPAAFVVLAMAAVVLSVVLASATLLALGLAGLVLGGAAFAVTPFWVLARSRRRPS